MSVCTLPAASLAVACAALRLGQASLAGFQVGEQQLGPDGLEIGEGVELAVRVGDVRVVECAYDVQDRVNVPDVTEEAVPETLSLMSAAYQPGDVHELDLLGD